MSAQDTVFWLAFALFIALVIVSTSYVSVRAASIAFFRTKLEYMRSVFKLNGRQNGQD